MNVQAVLDSSPPESASAERERWIAEGRALAFAEFEHAATVCERNGWTEGAEVVRNVAKIIGGAAAARVVVLPAQSVGNSPAERLAALRAWRRQAEADLAAIKERESAIVDEAAEELR